MGQNQSSLKDDQPSAVDDEIQILGHQPCVHSLVPGHARPIPPPQNRSTVLAELQTLQGTSTTPNVTDSLDGLSFKRSTMSLERDSEPNNTAKHSGSTIFALPNTKLRTTYAIPMIKSHDSYPRKKRRLFPNEVVVELAQKISSKQIHHDDRSSSSATMEGDSPESGSCKDDIQQADASSIRDSSTEDAKNDSLLNMPGPFAPDESEDEGYFTHSHNSAETAYTDEDEDGLVNQLAKMHRRSVVSTQDEHEARIPPPPDSPILRKLKEEDESAEQSRLLREKKLSESRKYDISAIDRGSNPNENISTNSSNVFDKENIVDGLDFNNYPGFSPTTPHSLVRRTSTAPTRNTSGQPTQNALVLSDNDSDHFGVDEPLDVAQNYGRKRTLLPKPRLRRINRRTPQYRRFPPRPHSTSRLAAEQYRTQNRHFGSSTNSNISSGLASTSSEAEGRLRTFTERKPDQHSTTSIRPQLDQLTSPPPQEIRKFCAIDIGSRTPRKGPRSKSPSPRIATHDANTGNDVQGAESTESSAASESNDLQTQGASSPRSMLQMMAQRAEERHQPSGGSVKPGSEVCLALGTRADIDSEDEDQVRKEHERLKEQQKDLEAIDSTCGAIARIRAIGPLTIVESKEEHELRKFVIIVLDTNRSGKDRRARMTHIRSNFVRRLEKEHVIATKDRVHEEYVRLLGEKRVKLLNDLREPLDDLITELKAKRTAMVTKRKSLVKQQRGHKQVRFAQSVMGKTASQLPRDIPDGMEIDLDEPKKGSRVRPPGKEERQIAMLTEQLRLFETQKNAMFQRHTTPSQPLQFKDSDSEQSEEEEGAEYVFGAGRDLSAKSNFAASTSCSSRHDQDQLEVDQDLEEINRLEDERQKADRFSAASKSVYEQSELRVPQHGFQRPDPELIEQMKRNMTTGYQKRDTQVEVLTDEILFDDIAEQSDSGTSLISSTSSVSTSPSNQPAVIQRFKYTVMGQFVGFDIYHPEEHYILKTFYGLDRANNYVQQVMTSLAADYKHVGNQDWELQTRCRDGMFEQVLALGKGDLVQAKVWVQRELIEIDLGKMASSKARKAVLAEDKGIWVVHWEKRVINTFAIGTLATAESTTNRRSEMDTTLDPSAETEDDDLFGQTLSPRSPLPRSPPPSATTTSHVTIISSASTDLDTSLFTTPALANRHAKQLYIQWYAPFFPAQERPFYGRFLPASGCPYEGALKQVDLALEAELERLGEWGLGSWEEEVEVEGKGEGERINERMKVWVQRVGVLGPAN